MGTPTTAKARQFLEVLADGCHRTCDYDEAEGGLVNHCKDCQLLITKLAHELFIRGRNPASLWLRALAK